MTKILDLPLKKEWYEMIENGIKLEEYREIKEYWVKRLTDIKPSEILNFIQNIKPNPRSTFDFGIQIFDGIIKRVSFYGDNTPYGKIKHYDCIRFRYGYTKRTMLFELKDIKIGIGKKEWGSTGKEVFILELGKRIK